MPPDRVRRPERRRNPARATGRAGRLHPRPGTRTAARRHRAAPPGDLPRPVLQQHRGPAGRQLPGDQACLRRALASARARFLRGLARARRCSPRWRASSCATSRTVAAASRGWPNWRTTNGSNWRCRSARHASMTSPMTRSTRPPPTSTQRCCRARPCCRRWPGHWPMPGRCSASARISSRASHRCSRRSCCCSRGRWPDPVPRPQRAGLAAAATSG